MLATFPYPEPDEFVVSYLNTLRTTLILPFSTLATYDCLFPLGFPNNTIYAFIFSPIRTAYPTNIILFDLITPSYI